MLKTVLTDYALEPHKEKFFLRAVIRKNNELYKIVDFSGLIEKQLLFDTTSKPMPEKNYKVQIENIRKVGIEDRDIDFRLFGFKEFLTNITRVAFDKDKFNITYESTKDKGFKKITLEPEDKDKTKIHGFYSLNKDKTFKEVDVIYENKNAEFEKLRKSKYRTVFCHWKSNFERNSQTDKLQLNKAILNGKTEVYEERENYVFDFSYVYYAAPVDNTTEIKNNINLRKDMFDLKGKYNQDYWENHDVLTLTKEMQEFISKINESGKNSDFRTKTNIN